MPYFCARDDGWPKKRCYLKRSKTGYTCRHWLKGITGNGCGEGMWRIKCPDGDSIYIRIYGTPTIIDNPSFLTKETGEPK